MSVQNDISEYSRNHNKATRFTTQKPRYGVWIKKTPMLLLIKEIISTFVGDTMTKYGMNY